MRNCWRLPHLPPDLTKGVFILLGGPATRAMRTRYRVRGLPLRHYVFQSSKGGKLVKLFFSRIRYVTRGNTQMHFLSFPTYRAQAKIFTPEKSKVVERSLGESYKRSDNPTAFAGRSICSAIHPCFKHPSLRISLSLCVSLSSTL